MTAEIGHFALILALATALYQFIVPLYGASRGDQAAMQTAAPAALAQFTLIAIAFAALIHAYVTSDFSIACAISARTPGRSITDASGTRRMDRTRVPLPCSSRSGSSSEAPSRKNSVTYLG